jgi:hypothetical protein
MPDFGIMRGFNEKLFGDKLVAGQLPTQLGLIGSSNFGFDSDAQAFFDRVTAAGGTLSATEKTAVDTLVKQMKLDGTWTPMKAIYPMVGASAAACAQNLKSSSFTGSFTSGWTFASTGVTPNGTSAFMDTGLIPSSELSLNGQSYTYYSTIDTAGGSKREMGGQTGTVLKDVGLLIKFSGNLFYAIIGGNTYPNVSNSNSKGMYTINRTDLLNVKGFKNGSLVINSLQSTELLTISIYLGARNLDGVGNNFSDRECAFSSIGDGLTNTQASNFYTAVQAFQTTLSRQV